MVEVAVATVFFVLLVAGVVGVRQRRPDHVRCLRSIERLERELFPDWYPRPTSPNFTVMPGVKWLVDDPGDIGYLNVTATAYSGLPLQSQQQQWEMNRLGLLHSALSAKAKEEAA